MAQGRDHGAMSARMQLFSILLLYCGKAHAFTYVVGNEDGWGFNIANWPVGKSFKAGDILEFNYSPAHHNVMVVDEASYYACSSVCSTSRMYNSGHDSIQLPQGKSYFICGVPGHCQAGMRMAINSA